MVNMAFLVSRDLESRRTNERENGKDSWILAEAGMTILVSNGHSSLNSYSASAQVAANQPTGVQFRAGLTDLDEVAQVADVGRLTLAAHAHVFDNRNEIHRP